MNVRSKVGKFVGRENDSRCEKDRKEVVRKKGEGEKGKGGLI